jgi:hypothetical protein
MLINTDSEEFQSLCVIRQKQKAHEGIGNFVKSREVSDMFQKLVSLVAVDLIKQIDDANRGDEYAQEQIDTARTLGAGE